MLSSYNDSMCSKRRERTNPRFLLSVLQKRLSCKVALNSQPETLPRGRVNTQT